MAKLSRASECALDAFDKAAQNFGWAQQPEVEYGGEVEYYAAKQRLVKRIVKLESSIRKLQQRGRDAKP